VWFFGREINKGNYVIQYRAVAQLLIKKSGPLGRSRPTLEEAQ